MRMMQFNMVRCMCVESIESAFVAGITAFSFDGSRSKCIAFGISTSPQPANRALDRINGKSCAQFGYRGQKVTSPLLSQSTSPPLHLSETPKGKLTLLGLLNITAGHHDKVAAGLGEGGGGIEAETGRSAGHNDELAFANLESTEDLGTLLLEVKLLGKLRLCEHGRHFRQRLGLRRLLALRLGGEDSAEGGGCLRCDAVILGIGGESLA